MNARVGGSPEAQLLLACARTRLDESSTAAARAALARGIRWEVLLRTAELQGVALLVHASLRRLEPDALPSPHAGHLQQACRGALRANLSLVAELRRLLLEFEARNIPTLPVKGPTLAAAAYGSLALRTFSDLDILVGPGDGAAARRLLMDQGYVLGYHVPGQEYHLTDERRRMTVDLHERLAASCFPQPAPFSLLWSRRRAVTLSGGAVPALSPEDAAFVLCLHLAKDCCTWKERLSQLCDLAELMRAEPGLPWDRVLDHSRAVGGERMVLLALWLTRELLGTPIPEVARAPLRHDGAVPRVGAPVRERLLKQLDGSLDYVRYRQEAPVEDFGLHLALRERRLDRVRVARDIVRTWVGRRIAPSEQDRAFLPLPRALSPLYYLIRPVRVARDRLRRVERGPRRPSLMLHPPRRTP